MSHQPLRKVMQEGWIGCCGHITPSPHLCPEILRSLGLGWCSHITLRSWTLRMWSPCRTRDRAFLSQCLSLALHLIPSSSSSWSSSWKPVPGFCPLMAENLFQFSSLNLFMVSIYFLFLCQVCLLDLLPPQHFPCPHLFIESFAFFSWSPLSSSLFFHNLNFGQLSSLPLCLSFMVGDLISPWTSEVHLYKPGSGRSTSQACFSWWDLKVPFSCLWALCFSCQFNMLSNNTYHFYMSHSALLRQLHIDWQSNTKKLNLTRKEKCCFLK